MAALPLFLSAEAIRFELASRIEAATGRATRIDGPVSFSVLPTARLSAEGVGIAGVASDAEAFSVESVSFGLSLLPLVAGNIEIYGVTIVRPSVLVEVDEAGRTNWDPPDRQPASAAESIEDMIATAGRQEDAAAGTIAVLDRLSIGRVRIEDGTLVWRDKASGIEERIESVDLDIRVPEFDGAGTIEGAFTRDGVAQSLELEIGARPDPVDFRSVPIALTLTSDVATVAASGTVFDDDVYFSGTVDAEGDSLVAFAQGLGVVLPEVPAFGAFKAQARLDVDVGLVRIGSYSVDLGGIKASGAAAIALDRARPGIGLKVEAEAFDTALFVAEAGSDGAAANAGSALEAGVGRDRPLDLSPLGLFDANIDFAARELLIGSVPVNNLGVDVTIVGGALNATIRSANISGAPGSGTIAIEPDGGEAAISGSIEMNGLDAPGLIALAGATVPLEAGTIGLDVAFATHGATEKALIGNLDGSGRVSLVNGKLSGLGLAAMIDGDAAADEVDDVDILADFSSLAAPVAAKGGFTWQGERFTISARGEPLVLASGGTSAVTIEAASDRVDFGFAGDASPAGLGKGAVSLATPSLRNLLAWLGHALPAGGGLGNFSIKGAVALSEEAFSFEKADFTLDQSRGVGTGKVTFGATPSIAAGLAMTRLDVTPYLRAAAAGGSGATGGGTAGPSGGTAGGWSNDRIAVDGLKAISANLNFSTEEILVDDLRIGPSNLTATIADGRLSAELTEMALYSGIGVGTLAIDGSSETPSVAAFFRLDGIDALPFLTDAASFSRIEGTASLSFDVTAAGASEAALVASLNGKGSVDFRNGAIRGIDIPRMMRGLTLDTILGWQAGEEKTDFSQFSGTYTIERGIVTNNDLVLVGPLVRMTGSGTVNLPDRTLSYRVDPKIVASLEGQGGAQELEGFAVPVRVEGSWSAPRIYPEIDGILQDPQGALDRLRALGGGLFGSAGTASGQQPDSGGGKSLEQRIMDEARKGLGQFLGGSSGQSATQPAPPVPAPQPAAPAAETAQPGEPPPAEAPPIDLTAPSETPQSTEPEQPQGEAPAEAGAEPPADPATELLKSLFGQ